MSDSALTAVREIASGSGSQPPKETGSMYVVSPVVRSKSTNAAAEAAGLVVLHYDHDFDLIADVTGQHVEWIVPAGTVP